VIGYTPLVVDVVDEVEVVDDDGMLRSNGTSSGARGSGSD